jgi:hypothetical protein
LIKPRPELMEPGGGNLQEDDATTNVFVLQNPADDTPANAISAAKGAKGIVEGALKLAQKTGGSGVFCVSDYRPGSTTTSGNRSDHASNDANQAARDIAVKGIDALTGPPSPKLDKAVVAIGKSFGKNYGNGKQPIIDTFHHSFKRQGIPVPEEYRIQIIWRTPQYGGHMGHIHIGARRV